MRKGAGPLCLGIGLALGSLGLRAAVRGGGGGGGAFLSTWLDHKPLPPTRNSAASTSRLDSDRGATELAPGSIATGATLLVGIAVTIGCAAAREHRRGSRGPTRERRAPNVSCNTYYKYRKDGLPEIIFEQNPDKYLTLQVENDHWVPVVSNPIPGGEKIPALTKEAKALWLDDRIKEIAKYNPMTEEEFAEEIEILKWNWKRHWIPTLGWPTFSPLKSVKAELQRRIILRMPELFSKYRHFKPLILKYPSLLMRFTRTTERPQEDNRRTFDPSGFYKAEQVAGFTYADWAKEVYGKKAPEEEWPKFNMDDILPGKVAALDPKGAFIEIGAKTWAWCPNDQVSLTPIAEAGDVLSVGEEVNVQIIYLDALSKIRGDSFVSQIVVSITKISRLTAWDQVTEAREGKASQEFEVEVISMAQFGAVVRTKSGLEGFVPAAQLGDLAGEGALVGSKITVLLKETREENLGVKPERFSDYPIIFSYTDIVARRLGEELEEGQVVDAEVVRAEPMYLAVKLMGITVNVRKVDISSDIYFEIPALFEVDEKIKCAVLGAGGGEIRLSIRALEFKRGAVVEQKEEVFARAEETAEKYFTAAKAEKDKLTKSLAGALDAGDALGGAEEKPKRSPSTIVDDSDDEVF